MNRVQVIITTLILIGFITIAGLRIEKYGTNKKEKVSSTLQAIPAQYKTMLICQIVYIDIIIRIVAHKYGNNWKCF